jgi:arylformamidase
MRYYDVTLPILDGMPVYPGDPAVSVRPHARIADGAPVNLSVFTLGSHAGTHVDAPHHFLDDAGGVDRIRPEALIGPARVAEVSGAGDLDAESIRPLLGGGCRRLLFKTRNSARPPAERYLPGYAALTADAALLLAEAGLLLVGLDGPSADGSDAEDAPAHRTLLHAGVVILENLALAAVPTGEYDLICLPLLVPGADGAPARVILSGR